VRGRFIVIEGPDFSGKTTQAKLLVRHLKKKGFNSEYLREPGSTWLGERIRKILLDAKSQISMKAELFLYMAARSELAQERIRPLLDKGINVVCDRYIYSSIIYQGLAGRLGEKLVRRIAHIAVGGLLPDLVIVLDIKPQLAKTRSLKKDRIEKRNIAYQRLVRKGFLEMAKSSARFALIDGSKGVKEVHKEIVKVLEDAF
jgi:dTMP kinase